MADLQEELSALRIQIATLTARIHRLEQRAGLMPEQTPQTTAGPPAPLRAPAVPPARIAEASPLPLRPSAGAATSARKHNEEELEGKIGKLWLNRIGIVAILT